ncbi:GNAT family N-acetyltransferase [Micromonospora yasonensis]|uniref:GNAT family N-acetyltransferase n=1 Tax=Micromonospora yasonensis TaxID=1128667 RepID=UPI003872FB01
MITNNHRCTEIEPAQSLDRDSELVGDGRVDLYAGFSWPAKSVAGETMGGEDASMARSGVLNHVQDLWVSLTGVATSFPSDGVRVVVVAESRLCPPAWAGIVVLGSSGIATAPDVATARFLRGSLTGRPLRSAVEAERWSGERGVVDALGPASLAYLDEQEFRPAKGAADVAQLPPGHPDLIRLVADVSEDDAAESGIDEITSPVFVVRNRARVVAAAGYRQWPRSVAHLCVLTSSHLRGRGLGSAVASAAVAEALQNQLLPQWRARPEPSRRLARRLGFREFGDQVSLRITAHQGDSNGDRQPAGTWAAVDGGQRTVARGRTRGRTPPDEAPRTYNRGVPAASDCREGLLGDEDAYAGQGLRHSLDP